MVQTENVRTRSRCHVWISHEGDSGGNEGSSHGEDGSTGFGLGVVFAHSTTSGTVEFGLAEVASLGSIHGGSLSFPFSFGGSHIGTCVVRSSVVHSTGFSAYLSHGCIGKDVDISHGLNYLLGLELTVIGDRKTMVLEEDSDSGVDGLRLSSDSFFGGFLSENGGSDGGGNKGFHVLIF